MPKSGFLLFSAFFLFATAIFAGESARAAEPPKVAVTIKPLHSLVAAVMGDAGNPALLLSGGDSPHTHAARPSEARIIEDADLVFWIGPDLETAYAKPLRALVKGRIVTMIDSEGLELLPVREAGLAAHARDHEEGGNVDPHIWLDPVNAKAMVRAIAAALSEADPKRATLYGDNAVRTQARIDALNADLKAELAPVRTVSFLTYHDAFQYFERRYELTNIGAITISPEQPPGAKRLSALRAAIEEENVACVFTEPQFEPALAHTLVAGTGARIGTLDPETRPELAPGPDFYFGLMRALAHDLKACLAPSGG